MKKSDLKKLALMGIAGGIMLGSEAAAGVVDQNAASHLLAQSNCASCGSIANGCGGQAPAAGYIPSQGCSAQTNYQPYYPQAQMGQETAYEPRSQSYNDQQWGNTQQWNRQQPQGRNSRQQQQWGQSDQGQTGWGSWADNTQTQNRNMTGSELETKLSPQGRALYQSLSPEGQAMALKLANQNCKGQNACKGLNSCKTNDHDCAGRGDCAGTSGCNFKDPNKAVKVSAIKMAEKRARMNRN